MYKSKEKKIIYGIRYCTDHCGPPQGPHQQGPSDKMGFQPIKKKRILYSSHWPSLLAQSMNTFKPEISIGNYFPQHCKKTCSLTTVLDAITRHPGMKLVISRHFKYNDKQGRVRNMIILWKSFFCTVWLIIQYYFHHQLPSILSVS